MRIVMEPTLPSLLAEVTTKSTSWQVPVTVMGRVFIPRVSSMYICLDYCCILSQHRNLLWRFDISFMNHPWYSAFVQWRIFFVVMVSLVCVSQKLCSCYVIYIYIYIINIYMLATVPNVYLLIYSIENSTGIHTLWASRYWYLSP